MITFLPYNTVHEKISYDFKMLLHCVSRLNVTINIMISIEIFSTTNTVQTHVAFVD